LTVWMFLREARGRRAKAGPWNVAKQGTKPKAIQIERVWYMCTAENQTLVWLQLDAFDPAANIGLKAVMPQPFHWESASRRWVFPLNWGACLGVGHVANKHGVTIRISDELHDWIIREKEHQGNAQAIQLRIDAMEGNEFERFV